MCYIGKSEFTFRSMEMCMVNAIVQLIKRTLKTVHFAFPLPLPLGFALMNQAYGFLFLLCFDGCHSVYGV